MPRSAPSIGASCGVYEVWVKHSGAQSPQYATPVVHGQCRLDRVPAQVGHEGQPVRCLPAARFAGVSGCAQERLLSASGGGLLVHWRSAPSPHHAHGMPSSARSSLLGSEPQA